MRRIVLLVVVLVSIVCRSPAFADPAARDRQQGSAPSAGKRILWTLVGAGAGFGAGLFFGLQKFDDAIDSDRKVWTTAIVGAAAGGVAGALLSGLGSSNPAMRPAPPLSPRGGGAPLDAAITFDRQRSADRELLERVRTLNAAEFIRER